MTWDAGRVHCAILESFVEHGHPTPLPAEATPALRQLEADHGVVLQPGTTDVWIAHPRF